MKKGIVCTLGPASWNHIRELRDKGMTIARINGAFGIPYKKAIEELKQLNIPILVDLPGDRKKSRFGYITDNDLIDFAIEHKLDWVGLSYVDKGSEIKELKDKLAPYGIRVIAKIETKFSIENMEEIIRESDQILIDRGDLGSDIGFEKVPKNQLKILKMCGRLGKPVIVATEMMMSTLKQTKPSCSDVFNVYFSAKHGADFVMLSEETALGKNPIETVEIMRKILDEVEEEY